MTVRILGIDTGWTAVGFAVVEFENVVNTRVIADSMRTVTTSPTPAGRRESRIIDDGRRFREIHCATAFRILQEQPDIVAIEALSLGAPNVMSIVQQTKGYCAALSAVLDAAVGYREIAPQDVRRALGVVGKKGEKKPEKKAAIHRAVLRHSVMAFEPMDDPRDHRATEHEWDAAAVALACVIPVPIDLVLAVKAGRGAA